MSFQEREIVVTLGGEKINSITSNDVEVSREPIEAKSERILSFNTNYLCEIAEKAKYTAVLSFPDGEKYKLKDMSMINSDINSGYSFKFDSMMVRRVMKTKSKRPRSVALWVSK